MTVLIRVKDREAYPVRAIPFATGWTLSPDAIVRELGDPDKLHPASRLTALFAYRVTEEGVTKVLPKEWDRFLDELDSLSAELDERFAKDDPKRVIAWTKESILRIPAGTFVWKDEFEEAFSRGYGKPRWIIRDERPGDRALTPHPLLSAEERRHVLEGVEVFASRSQQEVAAESADNCPDERPGDRALTPHPSLSAEERRHVLEVVEVFASRSQQGDQESPDNCVRARHERSQGGSFAETRNNRVVEQRSNSLSANLDGTAMAASSIDGEHVPGSKEPPLGSALQERECRLKKWLVSQSVPTEHWNRLVSLGHSVASIYDALKHYPEFASKSGKGDPIAFKTFRRKFWKEQQIAKITVDG